MYNIMTSKSITDEWKEKLIEIDSDYGHHNPFKFLDEINDTLFNIYKNEKNYTKKHKFIKNVWYTDTLKEYVLFLEKQLSKSINQLKKNEEGFDNRNKILKKE